METNRGPGLSTGLLKSPPPMPTIKQPEEVILASLQYKEQQVGQQGQGRELQQAARPHQAQAGAVGTAPHDPSFTPTKMKKTQSAGIVDTGGISIVLRIKPDETIRSGGEGPDQD